MEPKWGFNLPLLPIGKFQRQRLVRKERGVYSNAAQSGRRAHSCVKSSFPLETQGKAQPPSDQNQRQHPEFFLPFQVLSLESHRQPLSGNSCRPQSLPPLTYGCCWCCHWPCGFQGQKSLNHTGQYIREVGKRNSSLPSPGYMLVSHVGQTW